ncbi:MAG: J domain-containing protein [Planctomycetales bacterium]|nr:J domain-containing protein [Planctomycetales bacterium]
MAEDYYSLLGIQRGASEDEIQKAYRKMARKFHPDLNPDDKSAQEKFKKLQHAYEVLSDPQKRELYNRYGEGFESMGQGGPGGGWQFRQGPGGFGGEDVEIDLSDLFGGFGGQGGGGGGFADIFKQFGGRQRDGRRSHQHRPRQKGQDVTLDLPISLSKAIQGGAENLSLRRDGRTESITVQIPPGIDDGKKIRLQGQGQPSAHGGQPGDLIAVIRVQPHPWFRRTGDTLEVRVPLKISEAATGASVDVPTPHGTVTVKVPPGTSSGAKLRLKGQGIPSPSGPAGDLLARIEIVMPKHLTKDQIDQIQQMDANAPNPRSGLSW